MKLDDLTLILWPVQGYKGWQAYKHIAEQHAKVPSKRIRLSKKLYCNSMGSSYCLSNNSVALCVMLSTDRVRQVQRGSDDYVRAVSSSFADWQQ